MLGPVGAALTVFAAGVGVFLVVWWLRAALEPAELSAPERVPFAGGHPPRVHALSRYHVRYYVMALVFLGEVPTRAEVAAMIAITLS